MLLEILTRSLFFALFYLLCISVIFLRNRFELTSLFPDKDTSFTPKISVCIPARNEQNTIHNLLQSLERQNYNRYDVHVLDDQSEDDTFNVASRYQKKYPGLFFVHNGIDKPADWLGKPWACHQLSTKCNGEILLFLDADTEAQPDFLTRISSTFQTCHLDMLTVWPKQKLQTFWEKTIIPVVFFTLVTLLPAAYVYKDPKWMPPFLRGYLRPKFAAACGQCMAFRKEAYEGIGGHEAVKSEVLEDVKMAQRIKEYGFTLRMFHGVDTLSCRMYRNEKEIFEGFRKNFLAGFNNSIAAFIMAALIHAVVFVLPFIMFFISFLIFDPTLFFLSAASVTLILLQRFILSIWYQTDPVYSLTHPIGVLWFLRLGMVKISDHIRKKPVFWKGREV